MACWLSVGAGLKPAIRIMWLLTVIHARNDVEESMGLDVGVHVHEAATIYIYCDQRTRASLGGGCVGQQAHRLLSPLYSAKVATYYVSGDLEVANIFR